MAFLTLDIFKYHISKIFFYRTMIYIQIPESDIKVYSQYRNVLERTVNFVISFPCYLYIRLKFLIPFLEQNRNVNIHFQIFISK